MAWIESHQKLKDDPKMLELSFKMGWSVDETIGKLHRFWWWCVDHAEDGDLRRFTDAHIAHAMCVDIAKAKELVETMVNCGKPIGFIEREPYFRVPNWWKYMQKFLHSKYGKTNPDRLETIRKLYHSGEHSGKQSNLPTYLPTPPVVPHGGNGELFEEIVSNGKWHPSEDMLRLGKLFKRKPSTIWSKKEIKALKAIGKIDPPDLELLENYYREKIPADSDYRRRDLQTLLNNFTGEVDRARNHKPNKPF